jgi:cytochrome c-type protein NapB
MEPDQSRRIQIALATTLMGATIYVLGNNLLAERTAAKLLPARDVEAPTLLREAGMFEPQAFLAAEQKEETLPATQRTLDLYYSRRAYPGAPPRIPHALLDKRTMGGKGCNGCHAKGGYMPAFEAYTPVTPHPEWTNCLSCHVPAAEKTTFRGSEFVPASRPVILEAPLPGGPPPVPHSLDNRTNCSACHAGPGAVNEIRTPHPQRQNCRQCHVSPEAGTVFQRP